MKAFIIEILALCFLYIMLASVQIGPLNVIIFMIIMVSVLITSIALLLKKNYLQSLSLLIMVAVLSFVSYTLGLQIPPQFRKDLYKHSTTVEESRTDNAFICEFQLLTDTIYNKCGIVAKYIFAEYDHHYDIRVIGLVTEDHVYDSADDRDYRIGTAQFKEIVLYKFFHLPILLIFCK